MYLAEINIADKYKDEILVPKKKKKDAEAYVNRHLRTMLTKKQEESVADEEGYIKANVVMHNLRNMGDDSAYWDNRMALQTGESSSFVCTDKKNMVVVTFSSGARGIDDLTAKALYEGTGEKRVRMSRALVAFYIHSIWKGLKHFKIKKL